jgi:NADH-quinone oxidoreductase subunit J
MGLQDVIFIFVAGYTIVSALFVALSRNIIYSAIGVFGTLSGVAGLYAFLGADFLAVIQFSVYAGCMVIIFVFAVMLTKKLGEIRFENPQQYVYIGVFLSLFFVLAVIYAIFRSDLGSNVKAPQMLPTTASLGKLLLTDYIFPFEFVSLLLVLVLIGGAVVVRKELLVDKEEKEKE